ncbi:GGDEF domain-containing protein [Massilia sp. S19_KUP03_FR1]|uniref:GGDEF domain-containing protein n=1 Tax=Massilia sp. S19_KUP03_FR1 TaxID=3025503 RepID=UPI002FCD98D0
MHLPPPSGSPASSAIARWRGEFTCPATEAAFLCEQGARIALELSRSLTFCAAFYLAFALTDVAALGYSRHTMLLLLARLAVAAVALGGAMMTRRSLDPARTAYRAATCVASFGMATFLLVVDFRPDDLLLHGMSMAIMLVIVYLFIPNRLVSAIVVACAASSAFLALAMALGTLDSGRMLTMGMLLLLANLFGAAAARRDAHLLREQYWTQQILTNLSVRDALTGTFNRRHLNAGLLDGEIARARRHGLPLTLIMCDLDSFKIINDTHGHQAGDKLLQDFARLLLSMTREGIDTVVRYGGEEFLLILPETNLDQGKDLAERMRASFASARSICGDAHIATTASFGVVSAHLSPQLPLVASHALIAHADELMYAAKRAGRNQVRVTEWQAARAA